MQTSKSSIFYLAHQLYNAGLFTSFSDALKAAWAQAKNEAIETIEFVKKSGEKTRRVITRNISNYFKSKKTERTKPVGLNLFVDMAKVAAGKSSVIISAYEYIKVA